MASPSSQQLAQSAALADAYKATQNKEAAKIALLAAVYYSSQVQVESPASVEAWINYIVPRIIAASDAGARRGATYYDLTRRIEMPTAPKYVASPSLGTIDSGVEKSFLVVGPYAHQNKISDIRSRELPPAQEEALLRLAKKESIKAISATAIRHAQAGSRKTIEDSVAADRVALGFVRVCREKPCAFCAMLASRGLTYRTFKADSFDVSDARFEGDGTAKVHDGCSCSLKAVFTKQDRLLIRTEKFADMWSEWGAGGGDAALRFRRGYNHWAATGERLSWEVVNDRSLFMVRKDS